jgi:hypothetical protein
VSFPHPDEVHRVLKPYEQQLMAVHLKAWERLIANAEWPTFVFASTGTKLMHDLIVQEAAKELDDMAGVHKIAHDKSVRYLIGDRVLFRFKKGSRAGLGSNIDTQANDDFIDAQVDLLGIPEVMKVELLWYPNRLRTKLDRVDVTARDGKTRLWGYAIGEEPDVGMLPTEVPIVPMRPTAGLVTMKPVKKAEDNEDDE